jgi:cobalt-zinc-cadmium efflux system membrane fusion protein
MKTGFMDRLSNTSILIVPFMAYSVLASSWLLVSCGNAHSNEKKELKYCVTDSLFKTITIDTVKNESVLGELSLSGRVSFDEIKVVKVYPLASGHVQEVRVALGDYVNAGQLLALVKSPDVAGLLNDAVDAKNNLAISKKNLQVTEDLYKSGLASEKDYLTAQNDFGKAQAAFTKSNEILKIYSSPEGNLSTYYIKAPISGFIVERKVNEGMEIRSDAGDNIFTISDLKDVWVLANVYETDIAKIKLGYDADVSALSYNDKVFKGKIDKVFNVLNPETKVMNIRVVLNNPEYLLKPGMFARTTIHYSEDKRMLSIPSASVIFDNNKNWVVRYHDKCNFELLPITIYKQLNDRTYIKESFIQQNDRIVTKHGLFIYNALKLM